MKYTATQYAGALYDVLQNKNGEEYRKAIKNFVMLLHKNKDYKHLHTILVRYEKVFLQKQGLRKIEVESASPLSLDVRREIENIINDKILFDEKVNPELLAGMKLIIDDSVLIDASALRKIHTIFS